MTAVSVVTPFHNTARYLEECIESVLAQTYEDFEYVLLDNCSTDGSTAIAERWARRDRRIRLHTNDRLLPQVPNYNRALTLVSPTSRYCKVVQADDAIHPRCLAEMVALADAHPTVALVGSYFAHGERVEPVGMPRLPLILPGREACRRQLLEGVFLFGSPTTLLMRADLVRSRVPFYEEGRLFEDTELCFEILRTGDFGFVPHLLSFSRQDPASIMGSIRGHAPALLDRLIRLRRFGPELLTPEEYRLHAGYHERRYWRLLLWALVQRRSPQFWDLHRRGLASIGETLGPARLLRAALEDLPRAFVAPFRLLLRSLPRGRARQRRTGRAGASLSGAVANGSPGELHD